MPETERINVFWFRRDLRIDDNTGLNAALGAGLPVLALFIFDTEIISDLSRDDARISFIYNSLEKLNGKLKSSGSSVLIKTGTPASAWNELIPTFNIDSVFFNRDYEPYAIRRDKEITDLLTKNGINSFSFKDQVIFEGNEILKADGKPYTVFTPYKNAWIRKYPNLDDSKTERVLSNFVKTEFHFPTIVQIGFMNSRVNVAPYDLSAIRDYDKHRDFPAEDRTTRLGPYLRFGTISIRKIVRQAAAENQVFLSELIWREFFMQILFHFPNVVGSNFSRKYDNVNWRNNENEFRRWCNGETGYPVVDAGMRQMNQTGYMHNRVRMITAGFLCKHLLTAWWYGEAYFAEKLHDYELASNNGNWQWAAGTGCDAVPYFRIFNPLTQQKKFDPFNEYVRRWVPELTKGTYASPVVEHEFARRRALEAYKIPPSPKGGLITGNQ